MMGREGARTKLKLHQPARSRICAQGVLYDSWTDLFAGLTVARDPQARPAQVTILTGYMADQAALLGMLNRLYNLGLPLLAVEQLREE